MSVIVKNAENQLLLLCKGADRYPSVGTVMLQKIVLLITDAQLRLYLLSSFACSVFSCSVMFERLSKDSQDFAAITMDQIKRYAEAGLRTLVVAVRELSENEFKSWEEEFLEAQTSVTGDRDALVEAAAEKIERDLILLGATAVEDKLQKGVNINTAYYILFSKCFSS